MPITSKTSVVKQVRPERFGRTNYERSRWAWKIVCSDCGLFSYTRRLYVTSNSDIV